MRTFVLSRRCLDCVEWTKTDEILEQSHRSKDLNKKSKTGNHVNECTSDIPEVAIPARGCVGGGVGWGVVVGGGVPGSTGVGDAVPTKPWIGGRMAGFIPLHFASQSKFKHCPVIAFSH